MKKDKILDIYIPFVVKEVIRKKKPETESEFVAFAQALYRRIKEIENKVKIKEIKKGQMIENNRIPIEDVYEEKECRKIYLDFLNWMINDCLLDDVFVNPEETVQEYLKENL